MFNAELFTTEYLIEYLFKMYEQPGVHEYLVSKLYGVLHCEMDYYITFIVYEIIAKKIVQINAICKCVFFSFLKLKNSQLSITKHSPTLEAFLAHLS